MGGDKIGTTEPQSEKVSWKKQNQERALKLITAADVPRGVTPNEIYAANNRSIASAVHNVKIGPSQSIKMLHMAEFELGNKDSAIDFMDEMIGWIQTAPPEDKPDVVILHGMYEGDYRVLDKPQKGAVVGEYLNLGLQLKHVREYIDKIQQAGVKVIMNTGDKDRAIALGLAKELNQRWNKYAKEYYKDKKNEEKQGQSASDEKQQKISRNMVDIDDWQGYNDALKDPNFWRLRSFFENFGLPYMMRTGRELRSAEEMWDESGGEVAVEEAILLFEAVERLRDSGGKKKGLTREQKRWLDVDAIFNQELPIYDDFYLAGKTKDDPEAIVHLISHNKLAFSDKPAYQDTVGKKLSFFHQAGNQDIPLPDAMIAAHTNEGSIVDAGVLVMNLPGMQNGFNHLGQKAEVTSVPGHKTQRQSETRGRTHPAGAIEVEAFHDGIMIYSIFGEGWTEYADSLEDQIYIPLICDWQTHSRTAVPEMQARLLDYIRTKITQRGRVHFQTGGDLYHGMIYKDDKFENEGVGMHKMSTQIRFVDEMLAIDQSNYTRDQALMIASLLIEIGNHEWQNGTVEHGASFHEAIKMRFAHFFQKLGLSDQEIDDMIKFHDQTVFPDGSSIRSFDAHAMYGAYAMRLTHFPLERGYGGKGGSGNPAQNGYEGMTAPGPNTASVQLIRTAHLHHFSVHQSGRKFSMIDPSMARASGFEYRRGMWAKPGAAILMLGGKKPPQIMVIPQGVLLLHKIKEGPYSEEQLNEQGLFTDKDFVPGTTSTWSPDGFPKEALQKHFLRRAQQLSLGEGTTGVVPPSPTKPETKIFRPGVKDERAFRRVGSEVLSPMVTQFK